MASFLRPRARFARLAALVPIAAMLMVVGCTADGGGQMPSACFWNSSAPPATFGFSYVAPDTLTVGGVSGTYRDRCAGVALRGDGRALSPVTTPSGGPLLFGCAGFVPPDSVAPALLGSQVDYVSINPARPGSGSLHLFACDLGIPGPSEGDLVFVSVDNGPFAGYTNFGFTTHGNIVVMSDN